METFRYFRSLAIVASLTACANGVASPPRELIVNNFDPSKPPCVVHLPDSPDTTSCNADGCDISSPKGSSLGLIHVSFSCLPKSAPTGFENPPHYARIQAFRSSTSPGHISEIDSIDLPADERVRELSFCIYGEINNLCGFAQTLLLKDGEKADGGKKVKSLIRSLGLR